MEADMKNLFYILLTIATVGSSCSSDDCIDIDLSGMGDGSCDENNNEDIVPSNLPVVSSSGIITVTSYGATIDGNVISDGGSPVIARGVYWNRSPYLHLESTLHTVDGSGTGPFTSSIRLESGEFHVWVYAKNSNGISTNYVGSFQIGIPP